jgi:hypothetical protein
MELGLTEAGRKPTETWRKVPDKVGCLETKRIDRGSAWSSNMA